MTISINEIPALARDLSDKDPRDILSFAFENIEELAISFSGAEDVVLIDLSQRIAAKLNRPLTVFTLDTGRLHPETYEYLDRVRKHYGIELEVMSPRAEDLQAFTQKKGFFSFYEDGHKECCGVRKIEPLRRRLSTLSGWITGQRRDQSPSTRAEVAVIEHDTAFGSEDSPLIKFNPLAGWSSAQVWEYIRMFDVPYNRLHEQGYTSIGCQPCTRPVLPNQHEREGRWWWEESTIKECGLHVKNIS